jgi:mannitol-1-/sugar-/sorbitol-6-/2-deoxyglucose-6-phosphatase
MSIQVVIFDMDGVLVDSEVYWLQSRVEFAQSLGKLWTMDDQRLTMGRNTVEWAHVMHERLHLDMEIDDIIAEIKGRVIAHYEERLPLLPGAIEAVHTAASGYRIALASGSPTEIIQRVMQLTELDKIFEFMVYGDDQPNGKPAPDIYIETARLLKMSPEDCVGIEDSVNGVRALKAANMVAIAVPSPGFTLPDDIAAMADRILPSLEHFSLDLVREIKTN